MKNSIIIDVDTDRTPIITISKPLDQEIPSDVDAVKAMILNDITCVSETLSTLINMADQNGYANKNNLVNTIVVRLQEMLVDETV
jgi:hypothetical protein